MAGKCKVCASPSREMIESRLLKGESIVSLSTWLLTQGESIAAPSILRHKTNHFEPTRLENDFVGVAPLKPLESDLNAYYAPFIDTAAVMDQITKELIDTDVFESVINERKFTQLLIEKIVQKQLVIVHELQDQYTAGKSGYPDSQIRGLKTILDIANSLPTYKNDNLLREIRTDNQKAYVNRILQTAVDLATTENTKYKTWQILKTPPVLNPPYELIDQYAKKIYPGDDGLEDLYREEWREKTVEKWHRSFAREIDQSYDEELQIRKTIDYHIDAFIGKLSENDFEKLEKTIIKKIIDTFETVENAACNDQAIDDLIRDELPANIEKRIAA